MPVASLRDVQPHDEWQFLWLVETTLKAPHSADLREQRTRGRGDNLKKADAIERDGIEVFVEYPIPSSVPSRTVRLSIESLFL